MEVYQLNLKKKTQWMCRHTRNIDGVLPWGQDGARGRQKVLPRGARHNFRTKAGGILKHSQLPALIALLSSSMMVVQMALGFQDPRVRVEITDGIKWVEEAAEGTYDAIIVDSSDPVGPAEVLFQKVRAAHRGVLALGVGS